MTDLGAMPLPIGLPTTATRNRLARGLRRCPFCRRWISIRRRGPLAGLLWPHGPHNAPCAGGDGYPINTYTTRRPNGALL